LVAKIAIEKKVYDGAAAMFAKLNDKNAKEQCEMNMIESQRRMDFLQAELSKIHAKRPSSLNLADIAAIPEVRLSTVESSSSMDSIHKVARPSQANSPGIFGNLLSTFNKARTSVSSASVKDAMSRSSSEKEIGMSTRFGILLKNLICM
jgi:hypothetical protein